MSEDDGIRTRYLLIDSQVCNPLTPRLRYRKSSGMIFEIPIQQRKKTTIDLLFRHQYLRHLKQRHRLHLLCHAYIIGSGPTVLKFYPDNHDDGTYIGVGEIFMIPEIRDKLNFLMTEILEKNPASP